MRTYLRCCLWGLTALLSGCTTTFYDVRSAVVNDGHMELVMVNKLERKHFDYSPHGSNYSRIKATAYAARVPLEALHDPKRTLSFTPVITSYVNDVKPPERYRHEQPLFTDSWSEPFLLCLDSSFRYQPVTTEGIYEPLDEKVEVFTDLSTKTMTFMHEQRVYSEKTKKIVLDYRQRPGYQSIPLIKTENKRDYVEAMSYDLNYIVFVKQSYQSVSPPVLDMYVYHVPRDQYEFVSVPLSADHHWPWYFVENIVMKGKRMLIGISGDYPTEGPDTLYKPFVADYSLGQQGAKLWALPQEASLLVAGGYYRTAYGVMAADFESNTIYRFGFSKYRGLSVMSYDLDDDKFQDIDLPTHFEATNSLMRTLLK